MTLRDLRVALLVAAVVVVLGLLLGYVAGTIMRPAVVASEPPSTAREELAKTGRDETPLPHGGALPGWTDLYVNDYDDLLDPAVEARVRADLVELYNRTGIEATLLTIRGLDQWQFPGSLERFATELFNTWGIGDAERNDGVLILISRSDRKMRIEIGAGYDQSWNARMQRVVDTGFLPSFREEAYQRGIERGVRETIFELTGAYPGKHNSPVVERGWTRILRWLKDIGLWALAVIAAPLAGAAAWFRRYLRNRPRPCPTCGKRMLRAGEEADDTHLDGGQRLEEYLKSVDYDVWYCPDPACGTMKIIRYPAWFSGFGACPSCGYRTLKSTTTVITAATKTSQGKKRIDYDCQNCGHTDMEYRTIPKISDSNSGSGGGRSSFGGGSSSGGGASGSW